MVEKRGNELGVRATFDKRYITLAPVAGVVGLVGGPWLGSGVGVGVGVRALPWRLWRASSAWWAGPRVAASRPPTDYPADSPSH